MAENVVINLPQRLPEEYQEVEYLQSNGNQHFYSDIDIQDGLTVDSVQSYNGTDDMYLFGGYVANDRSTFNGGYHSQIEGGYPTGYYLADNGLNKTLDSVYHIVTTHDNGTITIYRDGNQVKNTSGLATIEADGSKCAVFGNRPKNGGVPNFRYRGRVYSLKVSKNTDMLADYVPCYRKSDRKPGMYDLVTSTFYVNEGTGDFTVGPDTPIIYAGTVTLNEDGSADIVSTMGNISSYNGEALSGTWISSMDVYVEGATPTIGAQVVYELENPQSYHVENAGRLNAFRGTNNVWANAGDITVTYTADSAMFSFGSPLHTYNHTNLKLFGNTFIEHGKG